MTEEQQARRAEAARENGAKSRGPVSDLGKYIASLNSITTGEHLELLKEELPECVALLSSDCWISYLRLYRKHLRQLQPNSGCEQTIVRHMAIELFQLDGRQLGTASNDNYICSTFSRCFDVNSTDAAGRWLRWGFAPSPRI